MTMMADFLLQPALTGNTGRTGHREADAGADNRASSGGQDFSRILLQQRQSADIRPPQPTRNQTETPRPSEVKRTEQRRDDDQVARRSEDKPIQKSEQPTHDKAGSTVESDRQKYDTATQDGKLDNAAEASVSTHEDDMADAPALLDPLLEQIMQAHSEAAPAEPDTETGALVEGADVVNNLLAMIQGSAVPTSKVQTGEQAGVTVAGNAARSGEPLTINLTHSTGNQTATQDSELELSMEETGDTQPLTSQLLAAATAKLSRNETAGSPVNQVAEKGVSAGEARTDALMRSEAVQSAQAARQLQGQPLNMQQPGWSKELTDKVMWMSSQNLKSAEIKLNPAELGRLDIRVQVGQEHTQITFVSTHAGVRDSLDGQMHRLREMLEQQGMHDVDVEVADQSPQREQHSGSNRLAGSDVNEHADDELIAVSEVEQQEQGHAGLVSYYV